MAHSAMDIEYYDHHEHRANHHHKESGIYGIEKFTLDTLSVLGTDDDEFDAMTCTPNCNPKKGNPPVVTITLAIIYLVVFLATPNVVVKHNDFRAAAEVKVLADLNLMGPPVDPGLFQSFETYNSSDWERHMLYEHRQEAFDKGILEKMQNYRDPASFIPNKRQEIYRYWTYQFYHLNTETFVINILLLLIAGIFLELVQDWWRVLLIHTIGVIFAAMWSYTVKPSVLVGASGGVYAIIFAHFTNLVLNSDNLEKLPTRIIVRLPIIALMLYDYCVTTRSGQGTTAAAHIAGAFVGICVAASVLRNFIENTWERWTIRICNILLILATVIAFGQQFRPEPPSSMLLVNGASVPYAYNDGTTAVNTLVDALAGNYKIYCPTGDKTLSGITAPTGTDGYWEKVKDDCYNTAEEKLVDSSGNVVYSGCSLGSDYTPNGCNNRISTTGKINVNNHAVTGACNAHDVCYSLVDFNLDWCDEWFYYNLLSICAENYSGSERYACAADAVTVISSIVTGGTRNIDTAGLPLACA